MFRLIVRRLGWSLFVLWIVISLAFLLTNVIGDPAAATLGPKAHASQLAAFRKQWGLDRPISERYFRYLTGLARGDLGRSFRDGLPVSDVIATRLPRTALLGGLSILFELVIGTLFGVMAALRRGTWLDTGIMASTFVGMSTPTFLSGLLFLNYLAFRLGWFPIGGYGVDPLDHVQHAILPAVTLAMLGAATYSRVVRSEMIEVMSMDYVRTARSKGLSEPRVVIAHGLRNALLPIVTLVGLSLPTLVSGAIITEYVYAWPGMGRLAVESISSQDAFMVSGVVLVTAGAVLAGNLLADLAVAWLDPRIRGSL